MDEIKKVTNLRNLEYSPNLNPLIETRRAPIRTKKGLVATKMAKSLLDTETGEIHPHALIHNVKDVDNEHFVKVFAEGVKKAFELNRTEARVFHKVLEIYEKEKMVGGFAETINIAWFDNGLNGQAVDMTDRTFQKGLKGLLNKGFLSPKMPNVYWVNPSLFFKGDRVAFVTEYRRKSSSQDEESRAKLEANGQQRIIE